MPSITLCEDLQFSEHHLVRPERLEIAPGMPVTLVGLLGGTGAKHSSAGLDLQLLWRHHQPLTMPMSQS